MYFPGLFFFFHLALLNTTGSEIALNDSLVNQKRGVTVPVQLCIDLYYRNTLQYNTEPCIIVFIY